MVSVPPVRLTYLCIQYVNYLGFLLSWVSPIQRFRINSHVFADSPERLRRLNVLSSPSDWPKASKTYALIHLTNKPQPILSLRPEAKHRLFKAICNMTWEFKITTTNPETCVEIHKLLSHNRSQWKTVWLMSIISYHFFPTLLKSRLAQR